MELRVVGIYRVLSSCVIEMFFTLASPHVVCVCDSRDPNSVCKERAPRLLLKRVPV